METLTDMGSQDICRSEPSDNKEAHHHLMSSSLLVPKCCDGSLAANKNSSFDDKDKEDKNDECSRISGQSLKLWARGHWKVAEDAKLKELVALHGPQNWNRIAEKLQGRSGNFSFLFLFSLEFVKVIKCKFVFFWIFYLQVRVAD